MCIILKSIDQYNKNEVIKGATIVHPVDWQRPKLKSIYPSIHPSIAKPENLHSGLQRPSRVLFSIIPSLFMEWSFVIFFHSVISPYK